jgi:acetyl-CoA carboxylase carboxyl transferase subunit alpha
VCNCRGIQAGRIHHVKHFAEILFMELHGGFKDDKAMIGGLGKIGGQSL